MEQIAGIEPVLSAWEAEVLTIERYLHMVLSMGFEPIHLKVLSPEDSVSACFTTRALNGAPKETRTLTLESIGSLNRRVYLFHHRSKILGELIGSTSPNYQLNLSLVLCLDFDFRIVKGVLPVRLHNIYIGMARL